MKRLVPVLVLVVLGAAAWWLLDGDGAGDVDAPRALTRAGDASPSAPATPTPEARHAEDVAAPDASRLLATDASDGAASADASPWPEGIEPMSAHGRVLDAAGAPVAGALVLLIVDERTASRFENVYDYRPFAMDPDVQPSAVTADDGTFLLHGPWFPDGGQHQGYTSLVVHTPTYAPHSFLLRGYAGGDFDAGDLVLSVPGAELRVRLVDASGAAQVGVGVAFGTIDWSDVPAEAEDSRRWDNHATHLRTLSDADGELRLTSLWPLNAMLYFVTADERWSRHGDVDLRSGFLDLGTVVFDPLAGPTITGRVLAADGAPLADARVAVKGFEEWNRPPPVPPGADEAGGWMRDVGRNSVRTDANGRYVLRELDPDWVEHVLVVVAPRHEPALLHDVPFDSEAPELTLLPEATLRVDVRAADDGRALPDAELAALRVTGTWQKWNQDLRPRDVELQVDGTLVRQVGPFGTRVHVAAPGFTPRLVELEGLAPGTSRTLSVALEPAVTLSVHVVDDVGTPLEGVEVTLRAPTEWGEEFARMDLGEQHRGTTDADGLSTHTGLAEGTWRLRVSSPVHWSVRDIPCVIGRDDTSIEVALERVSSLRGTLLDVHGAPVVGDTVLVSHPQRQPTARGDWDDQEVHTDVEGRFAYRLLPAGPVTVLARNAPPARLEVAPGEQRELVLRQQAPSRIEGRVTSAGEPLEGARITFSGPLGEVGGANWSGYVDSDALGQYSVDVGVFGPVSLSVQTSAGGRAGAVVTSSPGGLVTQDFELGSASIGGVVVFPEGEHDLKWAHVFLQAHHGGRGARLELGADGRFRFAPLGAGKYSVNVMVSGLRHTSEPELIELAEGEQRDDLELHLEVARGLSGRIVWGSGQPFAGMLRFHRPGNEAFGAAVSVDDGYYAHDELDPGTFELSAAPVDFMQAFSLAPEAWTPTVPQIVTLADGEELEVDLVVPGAPPD